MGSKSAENEQPQLWTPTMFRRFVKGLNTSMGTAEIITDAGPAFIKALGNPEGPHQLACELVATRLAKWFGLPTFEFQIISIDAKVDEIPYNKGGSAASGPAFVSKAVAGHSRGGTAKELIPLVNPEGVGRLVVFDTWIRNRDRHHPDLKVRRPNYDNVFLEDLVEDDAGKTRLIAMDHTHCFTSGRDLNTKVSNIECIKDDLLYGLFPGFTSFVHQLDVEAAIDRLGMVDVKIVQPMIEEIPEEWEVNQKTKKALLDFVVRRADFVTSTVLKSIGRECWPDRLFDGN